jgi:hypothetical protein
MIDLKRDRWEDNIQIDVRQISYEDAQLMEVV